MMYLKTESKNLPLRCHIYDVVNNVHSIYLKDLRLRHNYDAIDKLHLHLPKEPAIKTS